MAKKLMMTLAVLTALTACEKGIVDDGMKQKSTNGNVTLTFSPYQTVTRASSADGLFTKVNYMLFDKATGDRAFATVRTQTAEDDNFGTVSLQLAEGEYDVLMVGHSSAKSASLAKDKVSFTASNGRKITDTFWQMIPITVGDEPVEQEIVLDRATAMFRLVITDETPASVTHFKFEYKGGSADFNPNTGNGITNSSQSELRDLNEDNTYEIYTFPKDNGKLTITVYALNDEEGIVRQMKFEDVPVKARTITCYTGQFFSGASDVISGGTFTITVNGDWEETNNYVF